ncbi:MAG: hypothetical protein AAFO82_16680, partial [Bacteroidota bacterium]
MKNRLLPILLVLFSSMLQAQVFVDANASGSNNGTSWANAYTDLGMALDNAEAGNELWVAAGTYTPMANDTAFFAISTANLSLYGGFNGTETSLGDRDITANPTILSGD